MIVLKKLTMHYTRNDTIPEQAPAAPALVFYDVVQSQVEDLWAWVQSAPTVERLDLAPLMLEWLSRVNLGEAERKLRRSAECQPDRLQ